MGDGSNTASPLDESSDTTGPESGLGSGTFRIDAGTSGSGSPRLLDEAHPYGVTRAGIHGRSIRLTGSRLWANVGRSARQRDGGRGAYATSRTLGRYCH